MKILILFLSFTTILISQERKFEDDLEKAFTNAKKGVYFALANIPEDKNSMTNDLIDNDKLVAKVKLSKEVRGVKIESEGVNNSYEVRIVVYRSYEKLKEEGFNVPGKN